MREGVDHRAALEPKKTVLCRTLDRVSLERVLRQLDINLATVRRSRESSERRRGRYSLRGVTKCSITDATHSG